jgi:hypothetical protein
LDGFLSHRIEQKVGDVVAKRAANQKLHREIVGTLGILTFVRFLGVHPTLREYVADRMGKRFKPHPGVRSRQVDDVVKNQMALI